MKPSRTKAKTAKKASKKAVKKTIPKTKKTKKSKGEATVYIAMVADMLHHGHINIIKKGAELGKVTLGLLTDEAVASYKRVPVMNYDERKKIIENVMGVHRVIPQTTHDYVANLRKIKPDYLVHGSDWKTGVQAPVRERAIKVMQEWGGQVVEPEYTKGISSTIIIENITNVGTTAEKRGKALKRILQVKPIVRVMEVHNGLTGRIVEKARVARGEQTKEFDAMWLSSLTDSTAKGKPDNGSVDFSSRQGTIDEIFDVTTKPMIVDGDNGGFPEHFALMVKTLERLGVSAVIIEDKIGLKANSLFGTESKQKQQQDSVEEFSHKISMGKRAQVTNHFMIIARIESLVLGMGMDDAIARAQAYIAAGADGIFISSKEKTPDELFEFCKKYNKLKNRVPLVVVPSTYSSVTEQELQKHGVNIVIYANHLLRAAYPAMVQTAETILANDSAAEAEHLCMPIKEILTLIPGGE